MHSCAATLLRGGTFTVSTPAFRGATHRSKISSSMASSPAKTDEFRGFLQRRSYEPPDWASHLSPIPSFTYNLGHVRITLFPLFPLSGSYCCFSSSPLRRQLPTPIHKWNLPDLPDGIEVWIKVWSRLSISYVLRNGFLKYFKEMLLDPVSER